MRIKVMKFGTRLMASAAILAAGLALLAIRPTTACGQTSFGNTPTDDWGDGFIDAGEGVTETLSQDVFAALGGADGPATMQLIMGSGKGHSYVDNIPAGIVTPDRLRPGTAVAPQNNKLIWGWSGGDVQQVTLTMFGLSTGEVLSGFSVAPDSVLGATASGSGATFTVTANQPAGNSVLIWNNLDRSLLSFSTNAGMSAQVDAIAWTATSGAPRILDFTDFNAAAGSSELPFTDGGAAGYHSRGFAGSGDTFAGWTWYTQLADTDALGAGDARNSIAIPFGMSTVNVAETMIRNGTDWEVNSSAATSNFSLRFAGANSAIALRKTYEEIGEGIANIDWVESDGLAGGLFAYYSQDDGATWAPLVAGEDFLVNAGMLDVLFVGNDGFDTAGFGINGGLELIAVSLPVAVAAVPEPALAIAWIVSGVVAWAGWAQSSRRRTTTV